ncbi:protease Do-like 9 isoform X2 [Rhododendron vialii]|uniref:protease Do-like 9 isoform X2 n=1 Tax=Rhododendron vialii TaxID=182163 RepID=UPI0026602ECD|nr:protease Do-like 9 isoform X2 [Rhododendron vialii]
MLATSPMLNSLSCNLSANFTIIDGNFQHSFLSIQPRPIPPDHHRLRSVVLSGCSSCRPSFSLRKASFVSQAETWLAEEDQGLEEEEEKKKKKISRYLASLVKVLCKKSPPDYLCPRQREPKNTTSSGFIVRGRKVLTCAHSVDNHTKVQLKKPNSDTLYTATVLSVALECDLALLTVNDDKFWEGIMPVDFGGMPAVQDKLAVLGYPNGKFSMTKTSVSRVTMVKFQWSQTELLGVKVNVAIEDGVSGAPVLSKSGKCVGMAFQSCKEDESDIIAAPVIHHFLEDYFRNGVYTGFPSLGIVWQDMENPDLRLFMKMGHGQQGVLIIEVKPNYPEYEILKPNDIILSIDGINIGNDGTVPFTWGQRIPFSYLLTKKYTGDTIDLRVLRNSEIREYSIVLTTHKQFKPANSSGRPFPYYIIAGFVFTTLSIPYLRSKCGYGLKNISNELIWQALHEERVVISKVLKGGTSEGYDGMDDIENAQVLNVNGMPVQNLKSFASIVESCNEEFLEFILDKQKKLVLHTASAKARTPSILKMHNIPSAMSDDLYLPKR